MESNNLLPTVLKKLQQSLQVSTAKKALLA